MDSLARRNIEIKARCADLAGVRQRMLAIGAAIHESLDQIDTYFHTLNNRLKLRQITGQPAQLIAYTRPNEAAARISDFELIEITDPDQIIRAMSLVLGIRGRVYKHREVLLWENVRIHLDRVKNLGEFIEFEAIVSENCDQRVCAQRLDHLMSVAGIATEDLIGESYSDLLKL